MGYILKSLNRLKKLFQILTQRILVVMVWDLVAGCSGHTIKGGQPSNPIGGDLIVPGAADHQHSRTSAGL